MDITRIDPNMSYNIPEGKEITWYAPDEAPMRLGGFAFYGADRVFRRMPLSSKELFDTVNPFINELCTNTTGGQVAFRTDSQSIYIKARLEAKHHMVNMPATGQCGFDCYVRYEGEDKHKFFGVTRWDIEYSEFCCEIASNLLPEGKDIIINFPLYMGVKEVSIGVDTGSQVTAPKPYSREPMIFYGTSITQGGCASRPGMAYTNILARRFNCQMYNFGFSANGLGEYEMAEVIASVPNPSLIALDYEANSATTGRLERSLEGFVDILRAKHPTTKMLVISRIPYTFEYYYPDKLKERNRYREFQRNVVDTRRHNGDSNIYFVNGHDFFGEDYDEYTVDFIHPSDLGFWHMANKIGDFIDNIL